MKTLPALGIAFIVLRLCEVIAWSWWWVLAPFWVPWAVTLPAIIFMIAFGSRVQRGEVFKHLGDKFR